MAPVKGRKATRTSRSLRAERRDGTARKMEEEGESADIPLRLRKRPWEDAAFSAPIPAREIAKAFGGHVLKYKKTLLQAFAAFFTASFLGALVPLSTMFVIDYLLPSRNYVLLWLTGGIVFILFLLRAIINTLGGHLLTYTSLHIVFDVRRRLFEHLQLLHLAFYEREQSGKLVSKLITDAAALQTLIQGALPTLSVQGFTIVITLAMMFMLSPRLTLFSLIILPVHMLVSHIFKSHLYRRSREVRERNSVVAGNVNEVITGIKVVKSFGMENAEQKRFVNMIRENLDYEIDLGTAQTLRVQTLDFITGVARAGVIVIGGAAVMSTDATSMTLGSYVAFTTFLLTLFSPIVQIANLAIQVMNARTGLERILHLLNITPQVVDKPNAKSVDRIHGNVALENVSFSYETGPRVLDQVNITAHPGEIVALVGPSGSGKSTIVSLLTRFHDVSEGRIIIDNTDIRDFKLADYRRCIGIVLQEPFLFSGTIRDNICYGSGRASQEQVEEAARQANALEFIGKLPKGMNTQVGERGQLLSGGQRQRISIARALLKDPDILILDEATSSLDTHSERMVQLALDRLMRGRTVFVVAHRLTTIRNADKIVVLDRGRVAEEGNHKTLMDNDGIYASLYAQNLEFSDPEQEEIPEGDYFG